MHITKIKQRMKVRLSKTLQETDRRWGLFSGMKEMKGQLCTVEIVGTQEAYVRDKHGHAYWFDPQDMTEVDMTKKPSPVMFDPKNIIE